MPLSELHATTSARISQGNSASEAYGFRVRLCRSRIHMTLAVGRFFEVFLSFGAALAVTFVGIR
jgi:hypothetical protein